MPIEVELPDERSATSLVQELFGRFTPELVDGGGSWRVIIAEQRHTDELLTAVEQWLELAHVDEVTVHLDGSAYALRRAATRRSG